jgi:hypothetical protein
MKKMFAVTALALAMSAPAFAPSFAQTNNPAGHTMGRAGGGCPMMGMMGRGMMGRGGMMGQGNPSADDEQMGALADRRLALLKTELKITYGQADVWKAYSEAAKARAIVMEGLRTTMMDAMDKGGAVDRMDIRIKSMEAMVESMKALRPATERLYAALTAEQKKSADQLIGVDCGAM